MSVKRATVIAAPVCQATLQPSMASTHVYRAWHLSWGRTTENRQSQQEISSSNHSFSGEFTNLTCGAILGGFPSEIYLIAVRWLFPNIGVFPPKWMVKIMENPMNKWMIWGVFPLFLETPRLFSVAIICLEKFLKANRTSIEERSFLQKKRLL